MHTHYDNLKVSRDAPFEVIRAAYKSLSQKYHPDRHADGDEANRIMRLINAAYEVLSDPVKREEHDRWIVTQEKLEAQRGRRPAGARPTPGGAGGVPPRPQARPQAQTAQTAQTAQQAQTARERTRKAEAAKAEAEKAERAKAEKEREREKERRERERREHEAEQQRRAERASQERRERQRAEDRDRERDSRREDRPIREDGFQPARLSGRSWSVLVYSLAATAIVVLLSDWTPGTSLGASLDTPAANAATEASSPVAAASAPAAAPAKGSTAATAAVAAAITSSIISTREETRYIRPSLTPKGEPWPERSGYVPGYPVLNTDGLSMVTIDNTRNKFDVFLKLVALDTTRPLPVRTSYVRSGTSFTMENIAPGSYDVRYRSLDTGEIFRSERFDLKEIQEATGTSFAKNILTLYSVEGKARNVSIPEREFP
ncbi:J domain-containing protein [Cupriavidus plantarum]|uniref:J domain-containing protein n=1 Tax=Cupriavidus plantarum TaxID=942865 RepID=UPI000EAFCB19|nr:J domain-containing protein [Cupriavidus plantarum]RLK45159.1 DnaJ-like protein [Cupriavidus plantarum]CAG2129172.1 Chaperone protein DnaJ [Cupriavidus plantarum]SMR66351.1 DnaJ domain-containing protein [Cupriavidus plantarum]